MTTFLDDLLASTRARVEDARAVVPLDELMARVEDRRGMPASMRDALAPGGVGVIAEIKRASPSRGDLAPGLDAREQAIAYQAGGAAAVSVLTEPERFQGSLDDLRAALVGLPVLRKDFIVDAYQVWEACDAGASAILLIVAALDDARMRELHDLARDLRMEVLVEVHDDAELDRALALEPELVGVNARDLRTFELDPTAFRRLRPRLPSGVLAVAESGIEGPDDVRRAAAEGADAVLVGESVVTAPDPEAAVRALVEAGRESEVRA